MSRAVLHDLLDLSDSGVWGDEDAEGGISVLRSTNFNTDGTLDFSNLSFRVIEDKKRESKLLREGDILLEKSGGGPKQPVGRVCLFRGHDLPHSFGNFIARLRPNARVLSEFLFYFLWHFHAIGKTSHYQKQTTGIRNLEYKRFLTIEVPVPPLPEQHRIVDLLSRAEGIVRLRRAAEKKAAELIPALFLDMFGDPATNPKGWPVRKVSDFVSRFEGGKNIQAGSENGSPYRILKVSAATSGTYRESESKPSPDGYNPPASHIVRAGDMLFSRANTEELVGATAIVDRTNGNTLLPDKLWRFVWAEPVEAAYMHALFQSPYVRRELGKLLVGNRLGLSLHFKDGGRILDSGDRVSAFAMEPALAAKAMAQLAVLKGWSSVEINGSDEFLHLAFAAALAQGLTVNPKPNQMAIYNAVAKEAGRDVVTPSGNTVEAAEAVASLAGLRGRGGIAERLRNRRPECGDGSVAL